jgi:uncharacterized protein (TIGR00369 family)
MHGDSRGDLHSDPQLDARVRPDFERSGLLRHLGARLGLVLRGEVHVHLAYSADITQQNGFFHAGATSTIADTAGGFAGLTVFRPGHSVLTVEFKINLLAPAQGESLEAIGRVIRSGRTLTIAQVDVYAIQSGKKVHVALAQQTLIAIPEK